jgi:hypothetical protein
MFRFTRPMLLSLVLVLFTALLVTRGTPAYAATVTEASVTCSMTTLAGSVEVNARYVRVQVSLASNLGVTLATKVVPVHKNGYKAVLPYTRQPEGTRLIIAVGEWDGTNYLQPAYLFGQDCNSGNVQPTATLDYPTPVASPTSEYYPPTPTAIGGGYIAYFVSDAWTIPAGGCVTLSWWAVDVSQVTLLGSNWGTQEPQIVENPSTTMVCPSAASNYIDGQPVTYTLTATTFDGQQQSQYITIEVLLPGTTVPESSPTPTPFGW